MTRWWRALLLVAPLPWSTAASADCTVSAMDVVFGSYDAFASAPLDFNGSITITCQAQSGADTVQVALNVGSVTGGSGPVNGSGASYGERTLRNGNNGSFYLGYNLYKDASRQTVWGDGTGGSQTVSGPGGLALNGGTATLSVYGRVRAGQRRYTTPGNYASVITATVTY